MSVVEESYDVVVIGAGHAGCEASLAAARMGLNTICFTVSMDSVAMMPCNPNIGGSSKGHLVREIDALGGIMGKIADKTHLQIKMLNSGKGPAVQALRAQGDKITYPQEMLKTEVLCGAPARKLHGLRVACGVALGVAHALALLAAMDGLQVAKALLHGPVVERVERGRAHGVGEAGDVELPCIEHSVGSAPWQYADGDGRQVLAPRLEPGVGVGHEHGRPPGLGVLFTSQSLERLLCGLQFCEGWPGKDGLPARSRRGAGP